MLIFRVVSPSLTKTVYIIHITGYKNEFNNMISALALSTGVRLIFHFLTGQFFFNKS